MVAPSSFFEEKEYLEERGYAVILPKFCALGPGLLQTVKAPSKNPCFTTISLALTVVIILITNTNTNNKPTTAPIIFTNADSPNGSQRPEEKP
jgi:hypothetical protein